MKISFCCFVFDIQLMTDVYNHRFWCRFQQQTYFLNGLRVCSEPFAFLKLVAGLLNIRTLNGITVRKPETAFWREFATEGLFQKILLLVNVKITLDCCHCAGQARSRRQCLILIMFGRSRSNFLMLISWNWSSQNFFCLSCWSIDVQLFPQSIFGLAQNFSRNFLVALAGL